MSKKGHDMEHLPVDVAEFIDLIVKKMRYKRKVRRDVRQELVDHFTDALADCENENEKNEQAQKLIKQFGNAKVLAKLIRRGKKRCRPLWKKAIIRSFQGLGIFVLLFILYSLWFFTGKPTVNVDYVKYSN